MRLTDRIEEVDYKDINPIFKQKMGQSLPKYKPPVLYDAKGDLKERWFVYFSYIHPVTGKFKRIKVYDEINKYKTKGERRACASKLIKMLNESLEGGYNPFNLVAEQGIDDVHTLAQAIPAYLKVKDAQLRGKTVMGYRSILKQFQEWAEYRNHFYKPLKQLTVDDVQDYFTRARKGRNISATTHNTELTTLRAFFRYWQERGKIVLNPASGIKRLREEVALHTIYNDQQIEQITTHLKASDTPRSRQLLQFIRFIYYGCIRPKELRMLKVGDIRMSTGTILIPSSASKSGRAEPVDISPGLLEVIQDMHLEDANPNWYVFGNSARGVAGNYSDSKPGPKPVGVNYFSRYYRDVLNELGLSEDHTLYAWKHTRNVHLYMQDKDLLRLMRHNRHTDPKVTMRYLRSLGLLVDTRIIDERRI